MVVMVVALVLLIVVLREGEWRTMETFADVLHWEGEKKMLNLKLFLTGDQPALTKLRWMDKGSKQYHITLYLVGNCTIIIF